MNCDEWRQMVIRTAKRTHLTRILRPCPQRAVVSSKEFSTQNLNGRARLPRLTFTASRSSAYCAFPGSSVHTQVAGNYRGCSGRIKISQKTSAGGELRHATFRVAGVKQLFGKPVLFTFPAAAKTVNNTAVRCFLLRTTPPR